MIPFLNAFVEDGWGAPLLFNSTLSGTPNRLFLCKSPDRSTISSDYFSLSLFIAAHDNTQRESRLLSLWLQWIFVSVSSALRMLSDIDLQQMLPLKDLFQNNMCVYLSVGIWTELYLPTAQRHQIPWIWGWWEAMSYLTWVLGPELWSNTYF